MKRFILIEKKIKINPYFKKLLQDSDNKFLRGRVIERTCPLITKDILLIKEVFDKKSVTDSDETKVVQVELYAYTFFNHQDIVFNSENSEFIIKKSEKDLHALMSKKYPGRELFGPSWIGPIRGYHPDYCELFYVGCLIIDKFAGVELNQEKYNYLKKIKYFEKLEVGLINFTMDCQKEYKNLINKNYVKFGK